MGLSPCVRGNLDRRAVVANRNGSIPARAGEPPTCRARAPSKWVYPRACGGTVDAALAHQRTTGLSPRVRGNHAPQRDVLPLGGSIPARAGEPRKVNELLRSLGSIPARAGEPALPTSIRSDLMSSGLSPRVRGNHNRRVQDVDNPRSIPARAGEPLSRQAGAMLRHGLSPRVRGNPVRLLGRNAGGGSIPARAGEPRQTPVGDTLIGVYPRACGGTANAYKIDPITPRWVYPRACGGNRQRTGREHQVRAYPNNW